MLLHFQKEAWAAQVHKENALAVGAGGAGQAFVGRTRAKHNRKLNLQALAQSFGTLPDREYLDRCISITHPEMQVVKTAQHSIFNCHAGSFSLLLFFICKPNNYVSFHNKSSDMKFHFCPNLEFIFFINIFGTLSCRNFQIGNFQHIFKC